MNDEYKVPGRNKAKDILAWTLLYGGTAAAQFAICTVAVAAGFVDKYAARNLSKYVSKVGPKLKKEAYDVYLETGSIVKMLDALSGSG